MAEEPNEYLGYYQKEFNKNYNLMRKFIKEVHKLKLNIEDQLFTFQRNKEMEVHQLIKTFDKIHQELDEIKERKIQQLEAMFKSDCDLYREKLRKVDLHLDRLSAFNSRLAEFDKEGQAGVKIRLARTLSEHSLKTFINNIKRFNAQYRDEITKIPSDLPKVLEFKVTHPSDDMVRINREFSSTTVTSFEDLPRFTWFHNKKMFEYIPTNDEVKETVLDDPVPILSEFINVGHDRIILTGGIQRDKNGHREPVSEAFMYDLETGSLYCVTPMNHPRVYHQMVLLHGQVYCLGGKVRRDILTTCERYNIETQEWEDIASMTKERWSFSACSFGQHFIYVFSGGGVYGTHQSFEKFNSVSGEWTFHEISQQGLLRRDMGSFQISHDQILVFGGFDVEYARRKECLIYDTNLNMFRTETPLLMVGGKFENFFRHEGVVYVQAYASKVSRDLHSYQISFKSWEIEDNLISEVEREALIHLKLLNPKRMLDQLSP